MTRNASRTDKDHVMAQVNLEHVKKVYSNGVKVVHDCGCCSQARPGGNHRAILELPGIISKIQRG
jgi:hypothetical protein